MIDLRGLTKIYQTPVGPFAALRGIDLKIRAGEFIAVVGKSGSGKSTLINMFTGIDHPTDGEILVAGTRVRELDEGQVAEWRGRTMGIVFQFFQLLPTLTLAENVMLPMDLARRYTPSERHGRAYHLLEQVGLAEDGQKFPAAVSGGQQQRAAVVRAMAASPRLVLADEPTGNLDARSGARVFEVLRRVARQEGVAFIVVTHDSRLAHQADRCMRMEDGLLSEDACPLGPG